MHPPPRVLCLRVPQLSRVFCVPSVPPWAAPPPAPAPRNAFSRQCIALLGPLAVSLGAGAGVGAGSARRATGALQPLLNAAIRAPRVRVFLHRRCLCSDSFPARAAPRRRTPLRLAAPAAASSAWVQGAPACRGVAAARTAGRPSLPRLRARCPFGPALLLTVRTNNTAAAPRAPRGARRPQPPGPVPQSVRPRPVRHSPRARATGGQHSTPAAAGAAGRRAAPRSPPLAPLRALDLLWTEKPCRPLNSLDRRTPCAGRRAARPPVDGRTGARRPRQRRGPHGRAAAVRQPRLLCPYTHPLWRRRPEPLVPITTPPAPPRRAGARPPRPGPARM